jgi:N-acetyl-gamma-glutamylphosphate reductase
VSGSSGAGAKQSPRNDPERLRDNVLPYSLVDHVHERELRRHLDDRIDFLPHVAPFFRGLSVTVSVHLTAPEAVDSLRARFERRYEDERLVRLSLEAPSPRDAVGRHETWIGGLAVSQDGRRAAVVATIDNLLGGAATQALRNVNLALGHDELLGVLS